MTENNVNTSLQPQATNLNTAPAQAAPVNNPFKLFENPEFGKVRTIIRNGEPWFVARDVALALGYAKPQNAIAQHCKYAELFNCPELGHLTSSPRGVSIIPESDVYALIFRSNLPKAEDFRRWLCDEVIPSIRKTGAYFVAAPKSYPEALRALAAEAEAREAAQLALSQTAEERDYFKRTKAEIGTRREATAMATASAATKRANNWKRSAGELAEDNEVKQEIIDGIADILGNGPNWKRVTCIPWLKEFFYISQYKALCHELGKRLRDLGVSMGIPPQKCMYKIAGRTLRHHVAVIDRFRVMLAEDPTLMSKYRWDNPEEWYEEYVNSTK